MNYHHVLGVAPGASPEEIKKAYRRQASKHHPDKGGDAEQFRQVQEAYEALTGNGGGPQQRGFQGNFHDQEFGFNTEDIMASFFGTSGPGFFHRTQRTRAPDIQIDMTVSLSDLVNGSDKIIQLNWGTEHIHIPAGTRPGTRFRLTGKATDQGNRLSDLIVRVLVHPPSNVWLDGDHILTNIGVDLLTAIRGGNAVVDIDTGKQYNCKIPAGSQPGAKLRLRNLGFHNARTNITGDLICVLNVKIPLIQDPADLHQLETILTRNQ